MIKGKSRGRRRITAKALLSMETEETQINQVSKSMVKTEGQKR